MANEYLVEIHKYISERIVSAENKKMTADANNEQDSRRFYEGQLQEWLKMRRYLANKVDLKTQKYF
jgi:hypothetical protein